MILKVAHKVILGFTFILISLLISSISSIGILTEIGDSTRQVDEVAIPALGHSNAIQIQLLKQAKLSALIATTSTTGELSELKGRFEQQGRLLVDQHKALTGMLTEGKNKRFLQGFDGYYQSYIDSVEKMFAAREGELKLTMDLMNQQRILDNHLNEASALLVDLSYLEDEEKQQQIDNINRFHAQHDDELAPALRGLQKTAMARGNTFNALMETVKVASLGQISNALYIAGGEYRRNM